MARAHWFQIELEFGSVRFLSWRGGNQSTVPGENHLEARTRTNDKLSPQATLVEVHVSALTTVPSLSPLLPNGFIKNELLTKKQNYATSIFYSQRTTMNVLHTITGPGLSSACDFRWCLPMLFLWKLQVLASVSPWWQVTMLSQALWRTSSVKTIMIIIITTYLSTCQIPPPSPFPTKKTSKLQMQRSFHNKSFKYIYPRTVMVRCFTLSA